MTTDNSWTQISEPSPSNVEERKSSKDQTVLEKSLDDLESIQMEDEVKNFTGDDNQLVIISRDAKAMVRHVWKAVDLHEQN
jgi:biopolymer transport protein ExbD